VGVNLKTEYLSKDRKVSTPVADEVKEGDVESDSFPILFFEPIVLRSDGGGGGEVTTM